MQRRVEQHEMRVRDRSNLKQRLTDKRPTYHEASSIIIIDEAVEQWRMRLSA